jgi:3-methyladenine DNA glycosylase/8-oxoguanine DNA glycosylase
MTGFAFDPKAAVAHLRAADPELGKLIDRAGPFAMELKKAPSVFAALCEVIVYQQLSNKAAATIFGRLCAHFPRGVQGLTAERLAALTDGKVRTCGISRPKLKGLRDLARRTLRGEVPTLARTRKMSDADVAEALIAIHGIGRWSVKMFLMFRLGRPDVLPVDDYSLRKAYAKAFNKRKLPSPEALAKIGARWAPYRTVASWYLWRALEFPKD